MSDHPFIPKSNSKIVPPFIPKPKESLEAENARLTAELAKCEEHNEALCERMQDLNSEVFTASCTNARLHSLFANSELENARLKAEVERLTFDPLAYLDDHGEWMPRQTHLAAVERLEVRNAELVPENARLKAEVERYKFTLEEERQIARQDWAGLRCEHDRVKRALEQAEAEVERLRKAGDELERVLTSRSGSYEAGNASHEWNAAKEGKPSV